MMVTGREEVERTLAGSRGEATLYNSNKVEGRPWLTLATNNRGADCLDKILRTGGEMGREEGTTRHGGEEGGEREMPSAGEGMRMIGVGGVEWEVGIGREAPIMVAMTGMQASRDILAERGGEGNLRGGGKNLREATPRSGRSLSFSLTILLSDEFFISSNHIYNSSLLAIYLSTF